MLLYFLRHCGELLNDEIIATALSMNEEDVKDALSFWVQVGLLTISDGVYSPMQAVPEAARLQEKEPVTSGVSAGGRYGERRRICRSQGGSTSFSGIFTCRNCGYDKK